MKTPRTRIAALKSRIATLRAEYATCSTMAMRRCVAESLETTLMQLDALTGTAPTLAGVLG